MIWGGQSFSLQTTGGGAGGSPTPFNTNRVNWWQRRSCFEVPGVKWFSGRERERAHFRHPCVISAWLRLLQLNQSRQQVEPLSSADDEVTLPQAFSVWRPADGLECVGRSCKLSLQTLLTVLGGHQLWLHPLLGASHRLWNTHTVTVSLLHWSRKQHKCKNVRHS